MKRVLCFLMTVAAIRPLIGKAFAGSRDLLAGALVTSGVIQIVMLQHGILGLTLTLPASSAPA
jgi:hypothetical protein